MSGLSRVLIWVALGAVGVMPSTAFVLNPRCVYTPKKAIAPLYVMPDKYQGGRNNKKDISISELQNKLSKNPEMLLVPQKSKQKTKKRTRRRTDAPKQTYVYASQKGEKSDAKAINTGNEQQKGPLQTARQFGMNPLIQYNDPVVNNEEEPIIVGQVRVGEDDEATSASMVYIIQKPAGWSILGSGGGASDSKKKIEKKTETDDDDEEEAPVVNNRGGKKVTNNSKHIARVKMLGEDGKMDVLEYNELDVLSMMTPAERAELEREGGVSALALTEADAAAARAAKQALADDSDTDDDVVDQIAQDAYRTSTIPQKKRKETASFQNAGKPSVVGWLKEYKAMQGTPIKGGNFWTAVAGATAVDDTGLVVLCPKTKVNSIHVEWAKYVAVVGNGKNLAPKKTSAAKKGLQGKEFDANAVEMGVLAKLRKGRGDDTVMVTSLLLPDGISTNADVVSLCQTQFLDGIRGDSNANPLDRRAARRLVHCNAMSVSSLVHDDQCIVGGDDAKSSERLPADIAMLADRRNHHEFSKGSFLGRASLQANPSTTAYREINGAADGFPGWTVDRYDKWLFVQHDENTPSGPLPSLHDGYTTGVYYFRNRINRSEMGSRERIKPTLLEGSPAPDVVPILENGVTYHVNLGSDLSSGIFLDQRPQRAWLTQNCDSDTRVLNCFAHCGAFSIAAAVAGASTVSLDLDKKWLDRVEPQLRANGIEDISKERHDCIYGDCFDWLARLGKRGEQYDIVILDPPSTSVGVKKKRWSVKNDMDELVALAAPLVKKGGLLWATTNSATISPEKFAKLCKRGLDNVGLSGAKLERIAPMPLDFPSVGPQPVTNLVWRIP